MMPSLSRTNSLPSQGAHKDGGGVLGSVMLLNPLNSLASSWITDLEHEADDADHQQPLGDRLDAPSTPSRATFPFKPASVMLSQKSSLDDTCNGLPPVFRPRPVVPALSLHPPSRRCVSFPVDAPRSSPPHPNNVPANETEIMHDSAEGEVLPFPVPINMPVDRDCWWLKEMARAAAKSPSTMVQIGQDEIEVLETESEADEIDIIEEVELEQITGTKEGCTIEQSALSEDATEQEVAGEQPSRILNYSEDEIRILQEKMKDLRVEMQKTEALDPELEQVFLQVEGAIAQTTTDQAVRDKVQSQPTEEVSLSALDHIRRTTVAVTGGTLTAAGIALIPCPIIPGALVAYGGLLVLATEFESAKQCLDTVREPLDKWLADDYDEVNAKAANGGGPSSAAWEDMIGWTASDHRKKDINDGFIAMMSNSAEAAGDANNGSSTPAANKAMKQFLRKLLMLDAAKTDEDDKMREGGVLETRKEKGDASTLDLEPLSNTSCHGDLPGCGLCEADIGDSMDVDGEQKQTISYHRYCSDGSITLNTLDVDGISRSSSRRGSTNSSYGNDNECVSWVKFGCNSFLDEREIRCQLEAIDKKR